MLLRVAARLALGCCSLLINRASALCVVVKYAAADAFVLTVYLTDQPKKGKRVWPKR